MKHKTVIVQLMGGLGNQMFQYAAGRALAVRNNAELYVDANSGFARDKVYRRTFELGLMPIAAERAGLGKQAPYWLEKVRGRMTRACTDVIQGRAWGTLIREASPTFQPRIPAFNNFDKAWMYGYWQCERYFLDCADLISRELVPPAPEDAKFLAMAEKMSSCNSVAVGVRLFEEVPGTSKSGVGGVTPAEFYKLTAQRLSQEINDLVFFVFCTTRSPALEKIELPGPAHYITHDNGFEGAISRLWLISRCRHHILSNSSFYWWGAWLAERKYSNARIIASDRFVNKDCVPGRWKLLGGDLWVAG
jgi:hypothetical protein